MKQKTCSVCGKTGPLWKSKPPMCKNCAGRKKHATAKGVSRTPAKKESAKQTAFRALSRIYYLEAIIDNKQRNGGVCTCDECQASIPNARGVNVCHIVGAGANKGEDGSIYLDKRNNFILGKGFPGQCNCGALFDDRGHKKHMKIWPRFLEIRRIINLEYYS